MSDLDVLFSNVDESIHLGSKESDKDHQGIQDESCSKKRCLVVGIESTKVGREEGNPNKHGGGHTQEDVPTIIK